MANYMTVIKINPDKTESFEQINLEDVDFIEMDKRKVVYYIGDQKYLQITTKSELEQLLNDVGFCSLDRPNLINIKKIKNFDEKQGKLYFVENPKSDTRWATVAQMKTSFLKRILEKLSLKVQRK